MISQLDPPKNSSIRTCFLIFSLLTCFFSTVVLAQETVLERAHEGVRFVVFAPDGPMAKGVEIVPAKAAIAKMIEAYDRLRQKSPFSAKHIDRLKKSGYVYFIYNPTFRSKDFGKITVAVFKSFDRDAGKKKKTFPVIVTGFGIHWPIDDLASVVAHELVGHGVQHLENRMKTTRLMEIECEAWLYEERAYQDLKIDKTRRDIIDFRKQLEQKWCADFRRYQNKHKPQDAKFWAKLNPDVDQLIPRLHAYTAHLAKTGVIKNMQEAKKAERER